MSADGDPLLLAILRDPDDDALRLVYADWLEESGKPERAAFIRLQLAGADGECLLRPRLNEWAPRSLFRLLDRPLELSDGWLSLREPVCGPNLFTRARFHRGLIDSVEAGMGVFQRAVSNGLFREAPVCQVRITSVYPLELPVPHLRFRYFAPGRVPAGRVAHIPRGEELFAVPEPVLELLGAKASDQYGGRGFDDHAVALRELGPACVRWARGEAGLPPLPR